MELWIRIRAKDRGRWREKQVFRMQTESYFWTP